MISLRKNEVHIWFASMLDHSRHLPGLTSILSQEEKKQALKFKFPQQQEYYVMRRGILRCLLSLYLDIPPGSLKISQGYWGKPYLSEKDPIHFSVSRSQSYSLYAFTSQHEIGVDIEYLDPHLETQTLSPIVLSQRERQYLASLNSHNQFHTFFRLWTAKEAYLKALGTGWLHKNEICFADFFHLLENRETQLGSQEKMNFPHDFDLIPEYASALFIQGPTAEHLEYFSVNSLSLPEMYNNKQVLLNICKKVQ